MQPAIVSKRYNLIPPHVVQGFLSIIGLAFYTQEYGAFFVFITAKQATRKMFVCGNYTISHTSVYSLEIAFTYDKVMAISFPINIHNSRILNRNYRFPLNVSRPIETAFF